MFDGCVCNTSSSCSNLVGVAEEGTAVYRKEGSSTNHKIRRRILLRHMAIRTACTVEHLTVLRKCRYTYEKAMQDTPQATATSAPPLDGFSATLWLASYNAKAKNKTSGVAGTINARFIEQWWNLASACQLSTGSATVRVTSASCTILNRKYLTRIIVCRTMQCRKS
jgi:hypothetical protein